MSAEVKQISTCCNVLFSNRKNTTDLKSEGFVNLFHLLYLYFSMGLRRRGGGWSLSQPPWGKRQGTPGTSCQLIAGLIFGTNNHSDSNSHLSSVLTCWFEEGAQYDGWNTGRTWKLDTRLLNPGPWRDSANHSTTCADQFIAQKMTGKQQCGQKGCVCWVVKSLRLRIYMT